MDLKRRRGELKGLGLVRAWSYVVYAYTRDVWFNFTTASEIFNDPARFDRMTFTARLKGYRQGPGGEKAAIAEFLCDHWLDQEDPAGDHC